MTINSPFGSVGSIFTTTVTSSAAAPAMPSPMI